MSQPEWMQKFQEIGQKGQEAVVTIGEGGIEKTGETETAFEFKKPSPASSTPAPAPWKRPSEIKAEALGKTSTHSEDDAAALFAAAGTKAAEIKSVGSNDSEDAAALFAAAGSKPAEIKVDDDEDAAALFAAAGAEETKSADGEEIIEEEIIEEEIVEESVVSGTAASGSIVEESVVSGSARGAAGTPGDTLGQPKMSDEEFGDRWVVDKERVLNDINSPQYEEVEVERDTGNEHYEEIYIDENGNEVVVQREGNFEEEVIVDENGNEIIEEIIDEEPAYDPAYDVENQRKLLQTNSKAYRSRMAFWVPYLLFIIVVGAVLFVLFYVILDDGDEIARSGPTQAPTPRNFLPLDPTNTGAIDVAATTPLNPIQANCDFRRVLQPHVIDQCSCTGSISIVADDIRARYDLLRETFIPGILPDFDEDIDSCAASNQALVWLSSGVNNAGESAAFVRRERFVLAYFYIEQGGVGWADNELWLSSLDVCLWDRVTCDSVGRVVDVNVSRNGLIGQLSGALSLLESIESFSAVQNELAGTIPGELFSAPKLKAIDISSNAFFGEIPAFPEDCALESIQVQANNLSGSVKPDISNAGGLSVLNLANNALNGALPTEMFSLPLKELYLATNFFSGSIPDAIGNTTSLEALTLGPNVFTGDIPTSLRQLGNLTRLVIEDVPELTGRLPASYGLGLTSLVEFVLKGTNVRGDIPDQFGSLTDLEVLDLSRNSFARDVPSSLGLLKKLKILHLQDNAFSGEIPSELGSATSLVEVRLDVNQLVGSIPSSLGNLQSLELLRVDGNFMNGRAPEEVCDLRQQSLDIFSVDCAERLSSVLVSGIICSIPRCCTECF